MFTHFRFIFSLVSMLSCIALSLHAKIAPLPDRSPGLITDRQDFQVPDCVLLNGFLGQRVLGNEAERLVRIDTDRLLEGYRKRPGRQAWDGEHVGKWLHAATLAWVNTGDTALRDKLDYTVRELAKCQLEDGYLGTYTGKDRWTEWDVWAHKYNLIGLLTYMRYTGDTTPLPTCRRMADMLCASLGDGAGQLSILKAGNQHVGMASTSVLEPMALLYRFTGDSRYLDFCHYIVRAWEQPKGPHILSVLLGGGGVNEVGNGKAYEMLSCLNGALELYRTTGEKRLLDACLNAWRDIVDKRLYITGTASSREHFHGDHELERANNTGETCVTVTWLQFNAQLLRLTGEARFAEQLECTTLNQLLGAQRPDCRAWGYYVEMEGIKPYSDSLDGHCCLSSGPRGLALVPTFAVSTDDEGLVCNLYDAGSAQLRLRDGGLVSMRFDTRYPADGHIRIAVDPKSSGEFTLKMRIPAWCTGATIGVNGEKPRAVAVAGAYASLRRTWSKGDFVDLALPLTPRLVIGAHSEEGRAALCYGPLVMALDESSLQGTGQTRATVNLAAAGLAGLSLEKGFVHGDGSSASATDLQFHGLLLARKGESLLKADTSITARWLPFAQAGGRGEPYQVWVKLPASGEENLLPYGDASCSDASLSALAIIDEKYSSGVEIEAPAGEAGLWFAVRLQKPADLRRFVYRHGYGRWIPGSYSMPAWFDASAGKPRIEIQAQAGAAWIAVGELTGYPATAAGSDAGLKEGAAFDLVLEKSVRAYAVRVIGRPCKSDAGRHALANCAELEAYGRFAPDASR